jgi:hypothetical protein
MDAAAGESATAGADYPASVCWLLLGWQLAVGSWQLAVGSCRKRKESGAVDSPIFNSEIDGAPASIFAISSLIPQCINE